MRKDIKEKRPGYRRDVFNVVYLEYLLEKHGAERQKNLYHRLPSWLVLSAPQSVCSFVTYNMTVFLVYF